MSRKARRPLALRLGAPIALASAALGGTLTRAFAAEPPAIRLSYSAPATCPARNVLERGIASRVRGLRVVAFPAEARAFDVTITHSGDAFVGEMRGGDDEETRTVRSTECARVVDALALITALAVDPSAAPGPPPESPAPPLPPPSASPASTADRRPDAAPPAEAWRILARAGASTRAAATPGALVGPIVSVEARRGRLAARAGASIAEAVLVPSSTGGHFTAALVEIAGCPTSLDLGAAVEIRPCAVLHGGAMWSKGTDIANPHSETSPWIDAGASVDVSWNVTRAIFAYAEGALLVPITRPTFIVAVPDKVVYDVPLLTYGAGVGAGVRFP